ncbi:MAG: DUF4232 domain-containing protein [Streptosporangiaceae bacterium]
MGSAMTRYGQIGWRVIAVVAFAGTAALAVTLTRVPAHPTEAALSSNLTQTSCATSGLEAWLGLGTTGSPPGTGQRPQLAAVTTYTLEFTNVSSRACSLFGYPEVTAYAGAQVGSAAADDTSVRPQPVMLEPGATAHSVLRITGTGRFQSAACAQVTAPELRVMLPDQAHPAFVAVRLAVCSRKGPEFMSVQPIQPRPGIPGFTMPRP